MVSESRTLTRKGGSEGEHGEEKVNFTVKEVRFQEGGGKQERKAFLRNYEWGSMRKPERGSGRKNSPGESAEFWFHSKSGQT